MQLWTPPRDEPELLGWWAPLLMVARLARADQVPWPVHIDQFVLLGRVDRSGSRLPVWVYRHDRSGGDIYADPTGQTYQYRPTPNAAGPGRFDRCDVRTSIYRAGLPEVVEPCMEEVDAEDTSASWPAEDTHAWGTAARPTTSRRSRCRPIRSRVPRHDRWLYAVPSLPA
jgi:hypothetical protein